MLNGDNSTSDI